MPESALRQVIDERAVGMPDRQILTDVDLPSPVLCDRASMSQLISSLLGNALVHGALATLVRIAAHEDEGTLVIAVANAGEPIPPEAMARLFQPFLWARSGRASRGWASAFTSPRRSPSARRHPRSHLDGAGDPLHGHDGHVLTRSAPPFAGPSVAAAG